MILLLLSICIFGFNSPNKADTAKSGIAQLIDPADMVQGGYYLLWDHGSGMSVAQFDRMENNNIYTTNSITPLQLLFSQNRIFSLYDAGNITIAGILEIAHLQLCVLLGRFVP